MRDFYQGNVGALDETGSSGRPIFNLMIRNTTLVQEVTIGAVAAVALPTTPLTKRRTLYVVNNSTVIVYLGDATVTTLTGIPLYPHQSIQFSISDDVSIWCIAGGAATVRILEGS